MKRPLPGYYTLTYDSREYEWKTMKFEAGGGYTLFRGSTVTVLRSDGEAALCRIAASDGRDPESPLLPRGMLVWVAAEAIVNWSDKVAAVGDDVVLQEVKVDESVAQRMREDGVA